MNTPLNQLGSLGRYTLLRELGRGGMSVVYLAKDTELGREVAIKCVDTSDPAAAKLAERLRSEAKLLAQLNHPNIVQLYDVVEQDNILGLVIEFIGGDTLTQRLKQAPTKEVKLKWLAEVADGLASAHQKGIAHCDLKADNVLITHDNIAKVADFGIAKVKLDDYLEDDGLTRMDSVSGSYFSLSPEQATGKAVDTRTDLFSLAILIYQSLVGEHPFGDTHNKVALLQRIIGDPLIVHPSTQATLGLRLLELTKNLLSKAPEDRLYSAEDTAELLRSSQGPKLSEQNDTAEILIQTDAEIATQSKTRAWKAITSKLALVVSGFLVGLLFLKVLSPTQQAKAEVSYIALDEIKVSVSENFNSTLIPLIKTGLQQSAESSLLSFDRVGLVDADELNSVDGDYVRKARTSGVQDIVKIAANCELKKCDIKIQRRSGERMAISQQTTFPIAVNSMVDLRSAVNAQLPKLFDESPLPRSSNTIELNEEDYRRYLEINTDSDFGVSNDPKFFKQIEKLINDSPNFAPSYSLYSQLGTQLARNTGQNSILSTVLDTLETAPKSVRQNKATKRQIIVTLIEMQRISEAKVAYNSLKSDTPDELFLSEIESSIAYAESDFEKLLQLDRQNAIWRPSLTNLYNLATSEFFVGNFNEASSVINDALKLDPNDPYSLGLKATIQVSLGELSSAISTYHELLRNNQDSNSYTNYGLALTLSGEYEKAIDAHKKAITLNESSALYHLNLADAFSLFGDSISANTSYRKVLSLLKQPANAQEYSYLAQTQAHLGRHSFAVKTLKDANQKYPDIAELDYAASIVNTLAGNYVAAVVDAGDAIDNGTAPIWFTFKWFKPLCDYPDFVNKTNASNTILCQ